MDNTQVYETCIRGSNPLRDVSCPLGVKDSTTDFYSVSRGSNPLEGVFTSESNNRIKDTYSK